MDKILNSKSFNLLKKSAPNLTSISLLVFLIWQEYVNGEVNNFIVGVMATLLFGITATSFVVIVLDILLDIVSTYFNK